MNEGLIVGQQTDIRDLFLENITSRGITIAWVSEQAEINYTFLCDILKKRKNLAEKNRQKLNEVLKTNF